MIKLLIFFFFFGIIGQLIEVWFTGIKSLLRGDYSGASKTYLFVFPVYATGGTLIKIIHENVSLFTNPVLDAIMLAVFIYVPLFYGVELFYGLISLKFYKRVIWDYGVSKYTPLGILNFKYLFFWLSLALLMHPIITYLGKVIDFIEWKIW